MSQGLDQLRMRHKDLQRTIVRLRGSRDAINDQIDDVLRDLQSVGRAILDVEVGNPAPAPETSSSPMLARQEQAFERLFGTDDSGEGGTPFAGLV